MSTGTGDEGLWEYWAKRKTYRKKGLPERPGRPMMCQVGSKEGPCVGWGVSTAHLHASVCRLGQGSEAWRVSGGSTKSSWNFTNSAMEEETIGFHAKSRGHPAIQGVPPSRALPAPQTSFHMDSKSCPQCH